MRKLRNLALAGTAIAMVLTATPTVAQDSDVERRVQELEQELILLRRQMEGSVKNAADKAEEALETAKKGSGDKFKMKGATPKWESADGRNKIEIDGRIHFDLVAFDEGDDVVLDQTGADTDLNSGTTFRRARLGVKGTIDKDWKYNFIVDAGGSAAAGPVALDVANLAYKGFKPFTITAGKHKVPSGFEETTSSNDIPFIERSLASNIGNTFSGKIMALSVKAHGDYWLGGIGVGFGSEGDAATDESLSVHGRLALRYVEDGMAFHAGINGALLLEPLQNNATRNCRFRDRPEIRVDGTRFIDVRSQNFGGGGFSNTECYSVGMELAGTFGPVWGMAEYFTFGFDQSDNPQGNLGADGPDLGFSAFSVSGGWILTGEHRKYSGSKGGWSGIKPKSPFSLSNGGAGAWELAARYSHADLIDEENTFINGQFVGGIGGEEDNFTVALNWYINNHILMKFNYINVSTDNHPAGGAAAVDFADFDVYGMRMQVKW